MKILTFFLGLVALAHFAHAQCTSGDCQNGTGVYAYETGQKYFGEFRAGQLDGYGIYTATTGDYYVGVFTTSQYSGYGTYCYKSGSRDRGTWRSSVIGERATGTSGCVAGDCQNGSGIYAFSNGDEYIGGFSGSYLQGRGVYAFANGERYVGDFKLGKREGSGAYLYTSGRMDVGAWRADEFISNSANAKTNIGCTYGDCNGGYGTYVFDDGSKYVGNFINSKLDGQGTYTTAKGERYTGEFKYGMYNGYGTYYYSDGTAKEGTWENNEFKESVASAKTGCVSGDCQNGTGVYSFVEGHLYKGAFKNGAFNGYGVYSFKTGDLYAGQFLNNKFHGKGKYTHLNGVLEDGIWTDNQFTGNGVNQVVNNDQKANTNSNNSNQLGNANSGAVEKRLALVIGNSAYSNAGALKNPVNDARGMESALREMGFDVIKLENASRDDMIRAINQFGDRLKGYDVGLFFFAGHGLQMKGSNFVIPISAAISSENDVEIECLEANRVLAKMESARNRLNIVILDACRNNPFERAWNRTLGGNGLASMNAPVGSFIAYATAPGSTASDGTGQNGLYTEQLLKFMRQPNLKIEDVFKQVRINVMQLSSNSQTPWESSSLMGDFFFKK